MSIGPLNSVAGSAAGSPLAQAKGADVERALDDASAQQRAVSAQTKAETASGIGETDGEDHQTAERDADGRRPWEFSPHPNAPPPDESPSTSPRTPDVNRESGTELDVTG